MMRHELEKDYICPAEAWKKLKLAKNAGNTVYIYGATGFGKTELALQFLKGKKYIYLTCQNGGPDLSLVPGEKQGNDKPVLPVVIDDIQFLDAEEIRREVIALMDRSDIWLLLLGRGRRPLWLAPAYLKDGFFVIGEEDLQIGMDEVQAFFKKKEIDVPQEAIGRICTRGNGNAYVVRYLTRKLLEGREFDGELEGETERVLEHYLENSVLVQWDPELLDFLMQVSVVDSFQAELAEMITGSHYVAAQIEKACMIGNFLSEKNGIYTLRPVLRTTLYERMERIYGSERVRECCYNAGLYYEIHDRITEALAMYEKCGNRSRIKELLISNARRNPGNGHYFELRKFYLGLEEKEIENSIILMAGMSMLYSMLLQPEESEAWYNKLKIYEQKAKGGEKREALRRLVYLDIALPQRGIRDIIQVVKKVPALLFDKGISLPEFSVTSNLPSTMNGGKDFCEWSRHDRELAASIGKLMEKVLGRYGKGLVPVALGESLYEKGGDTYEVLSLLSRSQMEAEAGGMPEIAFASVGIQVRLNLLLGYEETAVSLLNSFETRVKEQNVTQILPNLRALRCRLALLAGDSVAVQEWLREAPSEEKEFFVMERYRYLTKVRCYLFSGDYLKACALLEKLRYYAEQYERNYILMETGMLQAIAWYRMGKAEWKEVFSEALKCAGSYQFLRLFSEEGAAVLPLLEQVKKEWKAGSGAEKKWFLRLLEECRKVAVRYSVYLKRQIAELPDFTENALAILRLQADGLSAGEIAARLCLKPETVRYHIKQNYRKLGVSGKADAVLAARNLRIL